MRPAADPLKPLLWAAPVLVVSAPGPGDPELCAQDAALQGDADGQAEREMLTIRIVGCDCSGGLDAQAVRERLSMPPDRFEAALVGKDGGVALRRGRAIPLDELFARIDAMPMRREALRRQAAEDAKPADGR